jgi:hypothetical protein
MGERSFTDPMPVSEVTLTGEIDVLKHKSEHDVLILIGAFASGVVLTLTVFGVIFLVGG